MGAAYNDGVQVAGGRFLLFMDSDCMFRPGTIRLMARKVIDHPVVKGQAVEDAWLYLLLSSGASGGPG